MEHLYVHVPFCSRRCAYCDFSIAVRRRIPAAEYLAAIGAELDALPPLGPLETIYIGGGTPSRLPPDAVAALLERILCRIPARPDAAAPRPIEVTLEANPEDVTREAVRFWRAAGVNRVSLGVQSFDDRVLSWMHRVHDSAQAHRAIEVLQAGGIDDLSLDLIFALPSHLRRAWRRDLDTALAASPAHLSLYGLTVEPRTPLARWIARGSTATPSDEDYAREYLLAHERVGAAGLDFYEVSNAARPGHRSRHNSAYWTGASYRGLGPAAHSYDGERRYWNLPSWEAYRRALAEGRSPTESEEVLSQGQRELERLYLGLRTSEGVTIGSRPHPVVPALRARGWLVQDGERLKCSVEGWLRLDALVAALTAPAGSS